MRKGSKEQRAESSVLSRGVAEFREFSWVYIEGALIPLRGAEAADERAVTSESPYSPFCQRFQRVSAVSVTFTISELQRFSKSCDDPQDRLLRKESIFALGR